MHLHAGLPPVGRQKKVASLMVVVGLAFAALGSAAVSGPTADAGAARFTPAEYLGFGLLACGVTCVLVGLVVWLHAAVVARAAAQQDHAQPVNRWRGPLAPGRSL
jgi:hypothetical protein